MKWKRNIKWNTLIRPLIVLCSATISLYLLYTLIASSEIFGIQNEEIRNFLKDNRTLGTIIISAPVAFIIWLFRDQNATQQIENQRKDINLKEFQKIAEWVSGLHLIEDEKKDKKASRINRLNSATKTTENQALNTFSKRDGAVGLQIAAIHSLLPFFQGKHGDDFRRPALNLLTSAWLSLQQKDLAILETIDVLENPKEFDDQIKKIQSNAKSPIGVALTQVLLSNGGDNLLEFPEVFPNLCLAGMDFHLSGLDKRVLSILSKIKNCEGINLTGANLKNSNLVGINFRKAKLKSINLTMANVCNCNLEYSILNKKSLFMANLTASIIQAEKNINIIDILKLSGAVVLYEGSTKRLGKIILERDDNIYRHDTIVFIDLEKTRQENPSWKINVELISK